MSSPAASNELTYVPGSAYCECYEGGMLIEPNEFAAALRHGSDESEFYPQDGEVAPTRIWIRDVAHVGEGIELRLVETFPGEECEIAVYERA